MLPLVLPRPAVAAFTAGSEEVLLVKKEDRQLAPGAYGLVELRAGTTTDPTVLTLMGGDFDVAELVLHHRSRLQCDPCRVRVAGR